MKNDVKLHSAFTFMFIDMLMVLLIFFICLTPTFTLEGTLGSNLPKDSMGHPPNDRKKKENIIIHTDGKRILVGDHVFTGQKRYKQLHSLLKKLILQIRRFKNVDQINMILDHDINAPFESTIGLLDVCHGLPQTKQGFVRIVFAAKFKEELLDHK
ncbi:ExbD/TolR family protein [Candidatus Uabimicrobium sp. HlEnr_7]|uniref:ExbD/TolR family protein n=1 Tax=Candidatus Uabimicrobium helgolandensis TaxID=3095367 RepID=UPI003556BE4F